MISTRGRYALRVLVDLAEQGTDDFVPLNEIAERQGISVKYLEIILKTLVQSGLLKGHRGKGGGYKLTRKPEDYTVGEILELTEGTLSTVACLAPGAEECPRKPANKKSSMKDVKICSYREATKEYNKRVVCEGDQEGP